MKSMIYIKPKKVSKSSKGKRRVKSYDDAYLNAFYNKNKAVIDTQLMDNPALPMYGTTKKLFKSMVLDKMFEMSPKSQGYNYKKRVSDPFYGKKLTTAQAVERVYRSHDMWGDSQIQTENLKQQLKAQGINVSRIRGAKGKFVSFYDLKLISETVGKDANGKEITIRKYQVGNMIITFTQSPKGGTNWEVEYV